MRIFVGGILTETNTFSPVPTGLNDYRMGFGDDNESNVECQILTHLKQRIATKDWQCLPSFLAVAEPGGTTTRNAYETLREKLLDDLKQAMPVDMVLLPLHGAMVAEGYDDCEGDITQRARSIVGADVAIGVLLDLHCHLSNTLLNNADLIAIYREYPHTDILQLFSQGDRELLPVPCGDSVCQKHGNIYVIVNSIRTQVFSPSVFTCFGLSLQQIDVMIVKSIFHFYAAFAPASKVILMITPGALNASFTEIPYQKLSTDKYPWLDDPLGS